MTTAVFSFKNSQKYLWDGTIDLDTDTLKLALVSSAWHPIPDDARSTAYVRGDYMKDGTHYYRCQVAGTSAGSAPTFPTDGSTVTDGSVVWQDVGTSLVGGKITIPTRPVSTAVVVGQMYIPATPNGHWYEVVTAGTTGAGTPTYTTNGTNFSDGGATVKDMGIYYPVFIGVATVWADISGSEISGTGYTAGGNTLANPTLTVTPENITFDADDVTWTTATITARWAVIYRSGTVNSLTDPVLRCYLLDDTPADISPPAGTDFTFRWNAGGIIQSRNIP